MRRPFCQRSGDEKTVFREKVSYILLEQSFSLIIYGK